MNCEAAIDRFLESLTGDLDASSSAELESHLAACATCREASDGLRALWHGLDVLPQETPSETLRPRFYAMLHAASREKRRRRSVRQRLDGWLESWWPRQPIFQVGVALVALVLGLGLGPRLRRTPSEIEQLRHEIQNTRRLVAISMLQQQSPSQRLQGVSFSYQLQQPDAEVVQALLQTLQTDSNVNVRLAAADALGQYPELPQVRLGLIESFEHQSSPLVQIALIDLLVGVSDPKVTEMLRRVSQDPDLHASVRQRAQSGLQRPL